jgi:hypothetical protein
MHLAWVILRLGSLAKISVQADLGLVQYVSDSNELSRAAIEQLMTLCAEEVVCRWMKFHLRMANSVMTLEMHEDKTAVFQVNYFPIRVSRG